MFPDDFPPNLAIFVVVQVVAWLHLRTGLVHGGIWTIVATWFAADVALVARFGFDERGPVYFTALVAMQVWTLLAGLRFGIGRWRRSRPEFRQARDAAFQSAFVAWLRDDHTTARDALRPMVRRDPWDLQARILLGKVLVASGEVRTARRQFVAARRLDRDDRYGDVLRVELGRGREPSTAPSAPSEAIETADPSPA